MSVEWLELVKRVQAIAQTGITYAEGEYDLERYAELRDISVKMMSKLTEIEAVKIKEMFASDTGYQTPKVDVRGVVFREGKILMVKETIDSKWSLPGGWADIGLTPKEVAVKEVREETGFDVKPVRLLAVLDKSKHPHPPDLWHVYKMFILCEITGGAKKTSVETSAVDFFNRDELPELSTPRNTASQLRMLFEFHDHPGKDVIYD